MVPFCLLLVNRSALMLEYSQFHPPQLQLHVMESPRPILYDGLIVYFGIPLL
jgi:hypothetical protein